MPAVLTVPGTLLIAGLSLMPAPASFVHSEYEENGMDTFVCTVELIACAVMPLFEKIEEAPTPRLDLTMGAIPKKVPPEDLKSERSTT